MHLSRLIALPLVLAASLSQPARAVDAPSRMLQALPAGAPMLVHVRNLPTALENWQYTPFAQMWAEPEVQAFFAPAAKMLSSPEGQKDLADFTAATGLAPMEFLKQFPGEFVMAVTALPPTRQKDATPEMIFGAALGDNRDKIEGIMAKAREERTTGDNSEVTEEFQGETLHVTIEKDAKTGEPHPAEAWAIVDDVLWFGQPKTGLQQVIANYKNGGAEQPMGVSGGFASVYQRSPDAQAAFYVNAEPFVELIRNEMAAKEAADQKAAAASQQGDADSDGGTPPPPKPDFLQQMGITPEVMMHALGLDALHGFYGTLTMDRRAISISMGVLWAEQRGLLRLIAYGDAPAPQPAFVPADWTAVSTARVQPQEIMHAVMETAGTANPALAAMITQQLAGLKQQIGIDLEHDLFGAFGDAVVVASKVTDDATKGNQLMIGEQLWAASLNSAESLSRVFDVAWGMAPGVAAQVQHRDYLGQTINTITVPLPGPTGGTLLPISYAITPTYFFVDMGGTSMIEAAIQRLDGKGEGFWSKPAVVDALHDLPPGSCSFSFSDLRPTIHAMFVQWANMARSMEKTGGDDAGVDENGSPVTPRPPAVKAGRGLGAFIDPDAVPGMDVVNKHWSISTGAAYHEKDGFHFLARIKNAE